MVPNQLGHDHKPDGFPSANSAQSAGYQTVRQDIQPPPPQTDYSAFWSTSAMLAQVAVGLFEIAEGYALVGAREGLLEVYTVGLGAPVAVPAIGLEVCNCDGWW